MSARDGVRATFDMILFGIAMSNICDFDDTKYVTSIDHATALIPGRLAGTRRAPEIRI